MTPVPVRLLEETDSTNAEARRRAEAGESGPVWIVARRQTAGRGRRGREWIDQSGNLSATLLTTMRKSPAEAAQLTFVAALAVADLVDSYAPPTAPCGWRSGSGSICAGLRPVSSGRPRPSWTICAAT